MTPLAALEPALPSPFRAGSRYPSVALEPALPSPFRAGSRYPLSARPPCTAEAPAVPVRTADSKAPSARNKKPPSGGWRVAAAVTSGAPRSRFHGDSRAGG